MVETPSGNTIWATAVPPPETSAVSHGPSPTRYSTWPSAGAAPVTSPVTAKSTRCAPPGRPPPATEIAVTVSVVRGETVAVVGPSEGCVAEPTSSATTSTSPVTPWTVRRIGHEVASVIASSNSWSPMRQRS